MNRLLKWLCLFGLVIVPLIALAGRLPLLANPGAVTTQVVEGGADIRLTSEPATVPFATSCVLTRWQVEGIRAVRINGAPTVGAGEQQVCGEAPRLWITFQDGSDRVYRVARGVAFTPEYRLLALIVPVGLLLFLRLAGVRFGLFGRLRESAAGRARAGVLQSLVQEPHPRDDASKEQFHAPSPRVERGLGGEVLWTQPQPYTRVNPAGLFARIHRLRVEEPAHFYALLAIILVGALLRLLFLSQPMKGDEAVTFLNRASQSLAASVSDYNSPNNHVFHTVLVWVAYSLFGNAPWVIRLPVFIAGILTIPATYAAARSLYSRNGALLSAAVIATLPEMIFFSTNARGYMLVCLIFMLLLPLARSLIRRQGVLGWAAYTLLLALGFWTVPTMLYAFGILNLWLLLSILVESPRAAWLPLLRRFVLANLAAGALTLVLYLPVFLNDGVEAITANKYVEPLSWAAFTAGMQDLWPYLWSQWTTGLPGSLVALLVVGFGVSVIFHRRVARYRVPLAPIILVVMAALLLLQRNVPFARTLLFLLPVLVVMASAGLVSLAEWLLPNRRLRPALAASIALAVAAGVGVSVVVTRSVYYFEETAAMREAEEVAYYLQGQLRPNDAVISPLGIAILEYYFRLHDFKVDNVYLRTDDDEVTRVFALVERAGLGLPQVLERYGFTLDTLAEPGLLRRFESYDLYLVDKR